LTHAEITQALANLCSGKEWTLSGDNYADLVWLSEGEAPTLAAVQAEIADLPAKKAEAEAKATTDKAALLAKLGITADEAKLLLS
jgi:hypothetical protein